MKLGNSLNNTNDIKNITLHALTQTRLIFV